MAKKPTVLLILDGYGLNEKTEGNAVALAKTPVMDRLMKEYPFVKGYASGMAVGLPDGQMGNSEVGHLNMGAGRIVYQELTRITKEIQDGDFFKNEALMKAVDNCKANNSAFHVFGLLSDGGVHSHNTHLYGLLELAKREGLDKVYVHCFLDGRDTPPQSAKGFVEDLQAEMDRIGVGKIATVSGRYYAMDRDNNYDRVEKAYAAMTKGEGNSAVNAADGVQASYDAGVNDEFVVPFVVMEDGAPVATINDKDSVVFFNFRPDRAREITHCFCDDEFDKFERGSRKDIVFVCFTEYDPLIPNKEIAFKKVEVTNTFGEWLANNGMKQARIAETEKYAHVTFFFNGGVEQPNKNEERILVNSPKYVPTYDKKPRMSAYTVTDKRRRSGAEAQIFSARPVFYIMPAFFPRYGIIGYLIMLISAKLKYFSGCIVYGPFFIFSREPQILSRLISFIQRRSLLKHQTVHGDVRRSQCSNGTQRLFPARNRLPGYG